MSGVCVGRGWMCSYVGEAGSTELLLLYYVMYYSIFEGHFSMVMVLIESSSLIAANKTKVYEMFKFVSADCTPAFSYQLCLMCQLPSSWLCCPFCHCMCPLLHNPPSP